MPSQPTQHAQVQSQPGAHNLTPAVPHEHQAHQGITRFLLLPLLLLPRQWEQGFHSQGTYKGTDATSGGVSPPWRMPGAPNSAASTGHGPAGASGHSCGGGALNMPPGCSTASLRGRTSRICGARARFDEDYGDRRTHAAFDVQYCSTCNTGGRYSPNIA